MATLINGNNVGIWTAIFCAALHTAPVHAAWDYSLAAQIAMHDATLSVCGKIEPRVNAVLAEEWSRIVHSSDTTAIGAARKSPEYDYVYREGRYEMLKAAWGDPEEEAHACESMYLRLSDKNNEPRRWWRDRPCANVPLDSEKRERCGTGPRAMVSFENTVPNATISILRVTPSVDVSFPRAGTFSQPHDPGDRIVSIGEAAGFWAIPESVDFEWKEWPRTFPAEPNTERDWESIRSYVDEVRGKVQRKRTRIAVRGRIPGDIIAEALHGEQAKESGQSAEVKLKLFFIFTPDGIRFRWEQWRGKCIGKFGGDEIDLPRSQLLSGDRICGEPEPNPYDSESKTI